MLIDEVLPQFDVTRVDVVVVTGAPEDVYHALLDYDMVDVTRDDRLIGALFAVRGIPDRVMRLLGKRPQPPPVTSMRLADLPAEGEWVRLGEEPGREMVFGAAGRFWGGPIQWEQTTRETFGSFDAPGSARIAANLAVHPYSPGRVLVTYETRTAATDDRARRGICRYWRLLSPFIGIVLRGVLNGVKERFKNRLRLHRRCRRGVGDGRTCRKSSSGEGTTMHTPTWCPARSRTRRGRRRNASVPGARSSGPLSALDGRPRRCRVSLDHSTATSTVEPVKSSAPLAGQVPGRTKGSLSLRQLGRGWPGSRSDSRPAV
jgi:hypothetical protein